MCIVTVEFEISAEHRDKFMRRMIANAAESKRLEPGCRQFDVCADPQKPTSIFLYEVYDDRSAFDTHLKMDHFLSFDAATKDWIRSKTVRFWERREPVS
jgi:quinol monooxygenase YgiN